MDMNFGPYGIFLHPYIRQLRSGFDFSEALPKDFMVDETSQPTISRRRILFSKQNRRRIDRLTLDLSQIGRLYMYTKNIYVKWYWRTKQRYICPSVLPDLPCLLHHEHEFFNVVDILFLLLCCLLMLMKPGGRVLNLISFSLCCMLRTMTLFSLGFLGSFASSIPCGSWFHRWTESSS